MMMPSMTWCVASALEMLRKLLGMNFFRLHFRGYRMLLLFMKDYCAEIVRRFVEENGGPPRAASTPGLTQREAEEQEAEGLYAPGRFAYGLKRRYEV